MNPIFFEKNKIDLDNRNVSLSVIDLVADNDGADYLNYIRNRDNFTGWATTNSEDSANTEILIDCGETISISDVFFLRNNFKEFSFTYSLDNVTFTAFKPGINATDNAEEDLYYNVTLISARYFKLIINSTMIVDDDKFLGQIVITRRLGQLKTGFKIDGVERSQGRKRHKILSGKNWVSRTTSSWEFSFQKENVLIQSDIDLIEVLFDQYYGFLVWLCGGDESVFSATAIGWRKRDLVLMQMETEYTPQWNDGRYKHGLDLSFTMVESI